jgi:hypothetical protein
LFFLITNLWIYLGLSSDKLIGINDLINHHAPNVFNSNQSNILWGPIYDWLVLGGSKMQSHIGFLPTERLLDLLGFSVISTINYGTILIQSLVAYLVFRSFFIGLKVDKYFSINGLLILFVSLSLAFYHPLIYRIFYGHLNLFVGALIVPVFYYFSEVSEENFLTFDLIVVYILSISILNFCTQQLVVYFLPFVFLFLNKVFFSKIKIKVLLFFCILFFCVPYLVAEYHELFGSDFFRDTKSSDFIYSYTLNPVLVFFNIFFIKNIGENKYNLFLFHELKGYTGFFFLMLPWKQLREAVLTKKLYLLVLILFFTAFIFNLFNAGVFFGKIPGLNIFRIPSRSLILISLILFLFSFKTCLLDKKEFYVADLFYVFLFVLSLFTDYSEVLFLVTLVLFLFNKKSRFLPSRFGLIPISFVFLFFNCYNIKPTLVNFSDVETAAKEFRIKTLPTIDFKEKYIFNASSTLGLNTPWYYGLPSIMGYGHPSPKYLSFYCENIQCPPGLISFYSSKKDFYLKLRSHFYIDKTTDYSINLSGPLLTLKFGPNKDSVTLPFLYSDSLKLSNDTLFSMSNNNGLLNVKKLSNKDSVIISSEIKNDSQFYYFYFSFLFLFIILLYNLKIKYLPKE